MIEFEDIWNVLGFTFRRAKHNPEIWELVFSSRFFGKRIVFIVANEVRMPMNQAHKACENNGILYEE